MDYNTLKINELSELIVAIGIIGNDLQEAIDSFINDIPPSALTIEDEIKIQSAVSAISNFLSSVEGKPYQYVPSFAKIPYLLYDSSLFREYGYEEDKKGNITYTKSYSPFDSSTWSVWWESFSGFRLWWSEKGSFPTNNDIGIHYFAEGKEIDAVAWNAITKPSPIKYKIMEKNKTIGKIISWVSVGEEWEEVLNLFEGISSYIKTTWDKCDGSAPAEISYLIDENLWNNILSFLNIVEGKYVEGKVTFAIENEPTNVNFFQTTQLISVIEGSVSSVKEKWIRPLNQYGIVAIGIDEEEFKNIYNPYDWNTVKRNIMEDTLTYEEAGGWLFSGCYLVEVENWDKGEWIEEALEDDRVRQISFVKGAYEYEVVTAWENTRRKWEQCILHNIPYTEFIDWLFNDNDKEGCINKEQIENCEDALSNTNKDSKSFSDVSFLYNAPEMQILGHAFVELDKRAEEASKRNEQVMSELSKQMDRASKTNIPPNTDENVKTGIIAATSTAVTLGAAAFSLIQSGALCRIGESCKRLSDEDSSIWEKFKSRFTGRRPTGGKDTYEGFKNDVRKKMDRMWKSNKKKSGKIGNKINDLKEKLKEMEISFTPPDVSYKKCSDSAKKLETNLSK